MGATLPYYSFSFPPLFFVFLFCDILFINISGMPENARTHSPSYAACGTFLTGRTGYSSSPFPGPPPGRHPWTLCPTKETEDIRFLLFPLLPLVSPFAPGMVFLPGGSARYWFRPPPVFFPPQTVPLSPPFTRTLSIFSIPPVLQDDVFSGRLSRLPLPDLLPG